MVEGGRRMVKEVKEVKDGRRSVKEGYNHFLHISIVIKAVACNGIARNNA
jgi:hypothetical protein